MLNVTTTFETIMSQLEAERQGPAALAAEPTAFIPELSELNAGQQTEMLNGLIVQARDACTWLYQELRDAYPTNTRQELNAVEPLPTLNAIRKALVQTRRSVLRDLKMAQQTKADRMQRLAHLRTLATFDI